jgi:hypothetical protein
MSAAAPAPAPAGPGPALMQLALKELGADVPTTQSILRLAATLATAVNRWPGLHGPPTAEAVIGALRELLELEVIRDKLSAEEKAALRVVVDTVVPETLNLIVAAGRGEIDLRKPTPGCLAALGAMLCRTGAAVAIAAAPQSAEAQQAASILQGAASVAAVAAAVPASEKEDPVPSVEPTESPEPVTLETVAPVVAAAAPQ